jgi:hypothetical protein
LRKSYISGHSPEPEDYQRYQISPISIDIFTAIVFTDQ